jgi:hypothetical protein
MTIEKRCEDWFWKMLHPDSSIRNNCFETSLIGSDIL